MIKVEETDKGLVAELAARKGARPLCGTCKRRRSGYDRLPMRRWRYVPLWGIAFELQYRPRRVDCRQCGVTAEHMPWSMGNSRLSLHMIVFCSILARLMSRQEVARLVHTHWNTVKAAVAKYSASQLRADFLIPAENALALFGVSQARESTIGRFGWLP
ncbi:MAG: hypothetical protein ABIF71_09110 [Planctomycetota bacterium]